jgi:hypothetical protein
MSHTTSAPTTPRGTFAGDRYVDARLGFSIAMPVGWTATPQPGLHASARNTAVTLYDLAHPAAQFDLAVIEGPQAAPAFTQRGTPDRHVGTYPAFVADRNIAQGKVPCVVRIFLAGSDYVMATWCSPDAQAHAAQFEQALATYLPAPAGFVPDSRAQISVRPQDCAQVQRAHGYSTGTAMWGRLLAPPTAMSPARGWAQLGAGVYVCSNTRSADPYLFQCTELTNRFLREQWAMPHLPGSAGRYLDYYQGGARQPGVISDLPAGTYAVSDDASQGRSAFRPAPGDLLIFQDVQDPRIGWTSGLIHLPGHVAVISGVDATHVYIAQENYNDVSYFQALPLTKVENGYRITDLSGLPNRIVRGWIHFNLDAGTLFAPLQ